MKSQKARVYKIDGKAYQFNRIAFVDTVKSRTKRKNSDGKKNGITQSSLFEKIADRLCITPEAIKHWYAGNNSPVDITYIQTCADVLGVDFMNLLTPSEGTMEELKMCDKEVALIERIFGICMDSVYCYLDYQSQRNGGSTDMTAIRNEESDEYLGILHQAHQIVDASSLLVSSSVKYRLHRIINDMTEFQWRRYDRWVSVAEVPRKDGAEVDELVDLDMVEDISCVTTRKEAVDLFGLFFLDEEKSLAAKLGYSYTDIPDEYYETCDYVNNGICRDKNGNEMSLTEFHILDTEFEVTATIYLKDAVARLLKLVFADSFPELRIPD